ncbi:hypothetical protein TNCV_506651 [Trichonephila clavipes]|nr:hypothetical protein TNCV_506651 [Trichonephila clavipes]
MIKAAANDKRKAPFHDEFRGTRSNTVDRVALPSCQGFGSWLACHEFEPSATKDPPCMGAMRYICRELKCLLVGVMCRS